MSEHEEWRPVVGYEGTYEVSNIGRVRRDLSSPKSTNGSPGKILKQMVSKNDNNPYVRVALHDRNRPIHILVAEAFLGPRPEGKQVNHIDGNKRNPRIGNLEYVTNVENAQHALRLGLYRVGDRHGACVHPESRPRGEASGTSKLTEAKVIEIRALRKSGMTLMRLGEMFGVSFGCIHNVTTRKTWTHIPEAEAAEA